VLEACSCAFAFKKRDELRLDFRGFSAAFRGMSTVTEISAAIRRLSADERWHLLHEFADELWADWDAQIENDLGSGKLDDFISKARADISALKIRPLDEVIRNA
jgi:hypothetical protein